MVLLCSFCRVERAAIKRPRNGQIACKECFYNCFEEEIHQTIVKSKLFKKGNKVAIASSGGKDSTVLGFVLKLLNERYDYGLDLVLLSIDEGIIGYRDDSLKSLKKNQKDLEIPLKILSYKDIYGWTMDEIVKEIGLKNNCTFCGVFRRQALDRGAVGLNCDMIVTGHNADDLAETILMNVLRGDIARLQRSVHIKTGLDKVYIKKNNEISDNENNLMTNLNKNLTKINNFYCNDKELNKCSYNSFLKDRLCIIPRSKPFKYTYEKEIVMYAYFKKLNYFSTECIYSPNSYRGHVRTFLKDLEVIRPSVIIDIIHSGESFKLKETISLPTQGVCIRCGYISSQNICKACVMLEGLKKGQPKLGICKSSKVKIIKKNNKISFCRKDDCGCELIHKKSKKQLKKLDNSTVPDFEEEKQKEKLNISNTKIKKDFEKLITSLQLL